MERKESSKQKSEKRPRSEGAEETPPTMQRVCIPNAAFATETSVELLTQHLNFTALLLKEGFTFERFETYGYVYVRSIDPYDSGHDPGQAWGREYLGVRGGAQSVETCE